MDATPSRADGSSGQLCGAAYQPPGELSRDARHRWINRLTSDREAAGTALAIGIFGTEKGSLFVVRWDYATASATRESVDAPR